MGGCLGCCGGKHREGRPKREKKQRRRRGRRHHHLSGASKAPSLQQQQHIDSAGHILPLAATSVASDSEYHDAREAWSDADHSPLSSAQISPRASSAEHAHLGDGHEDGGSVYGSSSGSSSDSGSESSQESTGLAAKLVGCLSIIRASSAGEDELRGTLGPHHHHHHPGGRGHKLPAGYTFARRSPEVQPDDAKLCWDECEASLFQIRSTDYMQSKVKQSSSKAIYRLVAMDLFGSDTKATHVTRSFQLPPTGPPVVCRPAVPGGPEVVLPQLLIMNVQLPDYPAAFWGDNNGRGQSIVYYFQLREDFDPDKFENKAALGLLQRFVSNGREADGSPTRDRLKLIVRVANLDEWARVGPLNNTEFKLLQNYNEKPVLTRPQQSFHLGPNYLEVDLDVHNYAFIARKALWTYHNRLATVVWDMGFVIQGNCPEELPEQILGCGRIYRSDFRQFKHLSDLQHSSPLSTSLTPSVTGSRNSAGFERGQLSPGTPTAAAAAAGNSSSNTPQGDAGEQPSAAAAGAAGAEDVAAATTTSAAAAAAAVAAASGAAAVPQGSAGGPSSSSNGSANASSRGSGASADTSLVVSIAASDQAGASSDGPAAAVTAAKAEAAAGSAGNRSKLDKPAAAAAAVQKAVAPVTSAQAAASKPTQS